MGNRRIIATIGLLAMIAGGLFATGTAEEVSGAAEPTAESQMAAGAEGWSNPLIVQETDDYLVVLDAIGDEVRISKRPERTIVNYTSMLGIWYMAGGSAIARPDTRSGTGVPEAAMDIATTGHVASPNTEVVVSLEPDFVVLSGSMDTHKALQEVLTANGIESVMLNYEHYEDFESILDLFARINDNPEVVNDVVPQLRERVDEIRDRYATGEPMKFLSLFASARDVSAETNLAHTARMATLLGGENIVEEGLFGQGETRVTLSMERIIERNPDVVLVTTMGSLDSIQEKMKEDLESNEAWAALPAVQNGRVLYLPNEYFLYKPNEAWPEAFEYLGEVLYEE